MIAARYCLRKSALEVLDELCRVFGLVKEIHTELALKIVDNYDNVDLGFVDKSILHLVVTSPELTGIQKLIAIGKWIKLNSGDELMKRLFKTVNVENAAMRVKNGRAIDSKWLHDQSSRKIEDSRKHQERTDAEPEKSGSEH